MDGGFATAGESVQLVFSPEEGHGENNTPSNERFVRDEQGLSWPFPGLFHGQARLAFSTAKPDWNNVPVDRHA
ncbi:MAG TPA: hypothetical protein VIM73_22120 [Polyangiaceae bacterium]